MSHDRMTDFPSGAVPGPLRRGRALLLASVAAGALVLALPGHASAQIVPPSPECVVTSGTTVNCTGNLAAGVAINAPTSYTVLNVSGLTANIAPTIFDGIGFQSAGNVEVHSIAGTYEIGAGVIGNAIRAISTQGGTVTVNSSGTVTGRMGAQTIRARSEAVSGNSGQVTVDVSGSVSGSTGIYAFSGGNGGVLVESSATVNVAFEGIYARSTAGSATVDVTGNITGTAGSTPGFTAGANAIRARSDGDGAVSVTTSGNITGPFRGIYARSATGSVTVNQTGGTISAMQMRPDNIGIGMAIRAENTGAGNISVTSAGKIYSSDTAIWAWSDDQSSTPLPTDAAVSVTLEATGEISSGGTGIYAASSNGPVSATVRGSITAVGDGVRAQGYTADISVEATASVTATNGTGIVIQGGTAATLVNAAAIQAGFRGISAQFFGGTDDLDISNTGNINLIGTNSHPFVSGIYARGFGNGQVTIGSSGDITSATSNMKFGIRVDAYKDIEITNGGDISNGSRGIHAVSTQNGQITIDNTGHLTTGSGIFVETDGSIEITNSGRIDGTEQSGIHASGGTVMLDNSAKITGVNGISAEAITSANVLNSAMIEVSGYGFASSGENVTMTNSGNIVSSDGTGLVIRGGTATLVNTAAIQAGYRGISAELSAGGTGDLEISNTGNINLTDSDLQTFVSGIYARGLGNGQVTIGSSGDITAATGSNMNFGIGVYANKDIAITNGGDISNGSRGILAVSTQNGQITIDNTGHLTTGSGIYGNADGSIEITNTGLIDGTEQWGIDARSRGGTVMLDNSAKITGANGINASAITSANVLNSAMIEVSGYGFASSGENVTMTNSGNIVSSGTSGTMTYLAAVFLNGTGGADSTHSIVNTGNLSVAGGEGIYARSFGGGELTIESSGSIVARDTGIGVNGYTVIVGTVGNPISGTITSNSDVGMRVFSREAVVRTGAEILADGNGIELLSRYGTIISTGAITSATGNGIYGYARSAANSAISVTSSGTVTALAGSGIHLTGYTNEAYQRLSALTANVSGMTIGATGHAGVEFGREHTPDPGYDYGYDGFANSLTITSTGEVKNAGGIGELAVLGRDGNETVQNSGTVTGKVDLGTGTNSFANLAGGQFNMGSTVSLGAGNTLSNAGTLSPGGNGLISTTAITGNLTQAAGGTLRIDVDGSGAGSADLITVTGTATLSGTVFAHVLNPVSTSQEFTILTAAGGVTTSGLTLTGGLPTTFTLLYPDASTVKLGVSVDFTLGGKNLNRNQTALGANMNALTNAGAAATAGGMAPILNALTGISDPDAYREALNQMLPEPYQQAAMAGVLGAEDFADALMSCRLREGAHVFIAEGQCLWMDAGAARLDRDATDEQLAASQTAWRLGGGVQAEVSEEIRLGAGLRYERVNQDTGEHAATSGSWGHAGLSLKYTSGPLLLAAAASAGHGWLETERRIAMDGFSGTATGDQEIGYGHGRLRAGYELGFGAWYLKPLLDLDATWMALGDVRESGGNGAALEIEGTQETILTAAPRLEIGGQAELADGWLLRPYASAGASFASGTGFALEAGFTGAPAGDAGFTARTTLDETLAEVSAGLDLLAGDGLTLRLSYDGRFGQTTSAHAGGLEAQWRF